MTKPPTFDSTGRSQRGSPAWKGFPLMVAVVVAAHGLFCAVLLLQGCSKGTETASPERVPTNGLPSVQELWKTVAARSNQVARSRPPQSPQTSAPPAAAVSPSNQIPTVRVPSVSPTPAGATRPTNQVVTPVPANQPIAALADQTNRIPTQRILTNAAAARPTEEARRRPDTTGELAKAREHVIQPGETLWSISRKYGVSVEDIERANPSVVPTRLQVNSSLIIPAPGEKPAAREETRYPGTLHKVQKGDTLSHLARRYGVSVEDIQRENNLRTTTIRVGQTLKIPTHKRGAGNDNRNRR